MSVYSFTYTLHHILLIKLIATFPFDRVRTLHNFLFLAIVSSSPFQRPGIHYTFYKSNTGVHSFDIQGYLNDLRRGGLLEEKTLELTPKGTDFYRQVAELLRYERFPEHCMKLGLKYKDNLWRVNHEVIFHPLLRKSKTGRKIQLPGL